MILQNRVVFHNRSEQAEEALPQMPELPRLRTPEPVQDDDDAWLNDGGPQTRPHPGAANIPNDDATIRLPKLVGADLSRPPVDVSRPPADVSRPSSNPARLSSDTLHPSTDDTRLPSSEYISVRHPLWPLVLSLSERLWHELYQRPDIATTPDLLLVELVRKRAIDLLKADPKHAYQVRDLSEAERLLHSVVNETLGYGPLEPLMKDDRVYEITVIGPRFAYVERDGQIEDVECCFEDDRHMQRVIENMLRRAGRRLAPAWPLIDARLPDGTLLNAVLPPSAVNGPVITIRKPSRKPLALADLAALGALSEQMADYLSACVQARRNIVVCGDVASGRTTLLNAQCAAIPASERIATIEEAAELQLSQKHVVSLVSQLTGADGPGGVTMRDLLRHALRGGCERVVLGECRGDEALELLQAMYSGYNGALLCIYACTLKDCLAHLETLCLAAGTSMPAETIRSQLAATLDIIVLTARLRDGTRKAINIAEVAGFDASAIKLQSVFHFQQTGVDPASSHVQGEFKASGLKSVKLP
jgi:pilus assembly protein CpaF